MQNTQADNNPVVPADLKDRLMSSLQPAWTEPVRKEVKFLVVHTVYAVPLASSVVLASAYDKNFNPIVGYQEVIFKRDFVVAYAKKSTTRFLISPELRAD